MSKSKIKGSLRKFFEQLVSVRLTAILMFILIPVVIAGSLIPQGRSFSEYAHAYGIKTTEIFYRLYLTSIFTSPWFLILILLLGVNVVGCFIKSLREEKRSLGFMLVHAGLILLMAGGAISAIGRVQGEIILKEGEKASAITIGKKTLPLGFEIRLKDFELQKYESQTEKLFILIPGRKEPSDFAFRMNMWTAIPGTAYQFRVERYVADFRLDMATKTVFSASEEANNPAVLIHIKGEKGDYTEWVFAQFANFHGPSDHPFQLKYQWAPSIPKAFISRVEILESEKIVLAKEIKVNQPLRYKGFSIYQASYDSQEAKWTGLEVVKDPGTGLVYGSIVMILVGLILNIYVGPFMKKNARKK